MAEGRWLGLISTCAYFIGFLMLFCAGNAKHLSKRMVGLMGISFVLNIPEFGVELDVIAIISWCWGILVFTWLFYEFHKEGCLLKRTYNPQLDNLWFSMILSFCLAAAVPILMIFFLPRGLFGCTRQQYKQAGFDQLECIYLAVHTTSYCLFPLSFIPQLWVLHKLRRESIRPTRNIRFFLFCMMVYAAASIALFAIFQYDMWEVGVVTQSVAFVLITHRWLIPLCCGKKELKDAEGEDDVDDNKAFGDNATTGGVDVELPSYTGGGGSAAQPNYSWDDNWLKDDKEKQANDYQL